MIWSDGFFKWQKYKFKRDNICTFPCSCRLCVKQFYDLLDISIMEVNWKIRYQNSFASLAIVKLLLKVNVCDCYIKKYQKFILSNMVVFPKVFPNFFSLFRANSPITQKPVCWFSQQINWIVSVWHCTRKIKFSITDFFSKCDQTCRELRIWSYLLKKSLMGNFIFCAMWWED